MNRNTKTISSYEIHLLLESLIAMYSFKELTNGRKVRLLLENDLHLSTVETEVILEGACLLKELRLTWPIPQAQATQIH